MVSYQLAPEQQDLRDSVAQFAREVAAPVIGATTSGAGSRAKSWRKWGKLRLFGLPFSEEYGGMGGDYFALCLALEELARVDSSVAITLEAGCRWARCPSTASAPRPSASSGCRSCAPANAWPPSG